MMTLMMTVSGVRGIIGQTMTPTLAAEIGAAFGSYLGGGKVTVGRDPRPSGPMVQTALVSGLVATGCEVVDLGVVTTPGAALMTVAHGAAGGVMITASHNPIAWNGIKFFAPQGRALFADAAERVFERYSNKALNFVDVERLGRVTLDGSTNRRHVETVLGVVDTEKIRQARFKVVLDSVNGSGCESGRMLLHKLGCEVVHLNGEPTGVFAHTPEPLAENLGGLCAEVRKRGAAVGFAQDPDADRLAVVADGGRYIGEEYTLALAAKFTFARRSGSAAANLSTSRLIDDVAAAAAKGLSQESAAPSSRRCEHGRDACATEQAAGKSIVVHRSPVGEANVVRAMCDHACIIGGEGNGGVIDPRIVLVRDSLTAMAMVLNLLADEGRSLSGLVAEMPRYVMLKRKYEMPRDQIAAWLDKVRGAAGNGRINDTDGVRIDWPEGWVHLRPSNTEPIARVIVEAADAAAAESLLRRVAECR